MVNKKVAILIFLLYSLIPVSVSAQIREIEEFNFRTHLNPPWDKWKSEFYAYIESGGNIKWKVPLTGLTVLDMAMIYHDEKLAEKLIKAGVLDDLSEKRPLKAIIIHAMNERMATVLNLILENKKGSKEFQDLDYKYLVTSSGVIGDPRITEVLINFFPNLSELDKAKLFQAAVSQSHLEEIRYLINEGFNIDDSYGDLPHVQASVLRDSTIVLSELIEHGADLSIKNVYGVDILSLVIMLLDFGRITNFRFLDILISNGLDPCSTFIQVDDGKRLVSLDEFLTSNQNKKLNEYFNYLNCGVSK